MGSLTKDPAFLATTFVVIDFETTTPAGYPAQPIEVAALALRYRERAWVRAGTSTSLIQPPAFAPVTPADTAQTGLAPEQLRQAPTPAEALGALDRRFTSGTPYLLVAQHAATEANVIRDQREHCPALASRAPRPEDLVLRRRTRRLSTASHQRRSLSAPSDRRTAARQQSCRRGSLDRPV
jgi:DNA polymerase III subunit epsilon